ncbi:MAG: DNA-binding MarR family transcriptional regulator [Paracoccaceae bacterium]
MSEDDTDIATAPHSAEGGRNPPVSRGDVPLTISSADLLVDGGDQIFRKMVHAFFAFNARHETIRDGHARRIGLAGTEYTILISIAHLGQEAPVNVKTIAEHLHVTTGFITNTTRKLQTRGLVRKTRDTADKRKTNLTVTLKAIALLEELAPFQRPVNDAEFGSLSRAEFLQLSETIQQLVASSEDAARLQQDLEDGKTDT